MKADGLLRQQRQMLTHPLLMSGGEGSAGPGSRGHGACSGWVHGGHVERSHIFGRECEVGAKEELRPQRRNEGETLTPALPAWVVRLKLIPSGWRLNLPLAEWTGGCSASWGVRK